MNYPTRLWNCPECTFNNIINPHICEICSFEIDYYSLEIPQDILIKIHNFKAENKFIKINKIFNKCTNICLPVIHCINFNQVYENIIIAIKAKCDGVFLVNHDITFIKLIKIYKKIKLLFPFLWIGVNLLDVLPMNIFEIMNQYNVNFDGIWTDHFYPKKKYMDYILSSMMKYDWNGLYFGAVAFKYRTQYDIKESVNLITLYTDIIITSGEETGLAITDQKLAQFDNNIYPLALASGINSNNYSKYKNKINFYIFNTSVSHNEYFQEHLLNNLIDLIFKN